MVAFLWLASLEFLLNIQPSFGPYPKSLCCLNLKGLLGIEALLSSLTWLLAGFSSSLAVDLRIPSVSCPVGLSIAQLTTWELASSE